MNDLELNNQEKLFIDLDDKSNDNAISGLISNLIKSGYSSKKLEIKFSSWKDIQKITLDLILFNRVKTIQDLPDWVIIKLILSSGVLSDSNFKGRLLSE